jgi:hypothetical protein
MVATILFLFVCVINEPCDVDASRVLTNPFCNKESVMAVYRVSEKWREKVIAKSGKTYYRFFAKYRCGECDQSFDMRCDRESRCISCIECGRNRIRASKIIHGASRTATYRSWLAMHERCRPNHVHFESYGGRGISVCQQWFDFNVFLNDMGERLYGTSLDRIDVNGNYCPGNCRWANAKQQNRNKRSHRMVEINGRSMSVTEWSEQQNANDRKYIFNALNRGVAPHVAVFGRRGT